MASMNTTGLDAILQDMTRRKQSSGDMARAMVSAAVVEIREAWRASALKHGHRNTGDLILSIGFPGEIMDFGDALAQDVLPVGRDRHGTRNAQKAFILNYGTSRIAGSYWVEDAEKEAEPRVNSRLAAMWDDYIKTGVVPAVATTDIYGGTSPGGRRKGRRKKSR